MNADGAVPELPLMHQSSRSRALTEQAIQEAKPLRRPWKISDGGGLYLARRTDRRPVLALQLSVRRQAEDRRPWDLSLRGGLISAPYESLRTLVPNISSRHSV